MKQLNRYALTALAAMALAAAVSTPATAADLTVDVFVNGTCVPGVAPDGGGNDIVEFAVSPPEGAESVTSYWLGIGPSTTFTVKVVPAPGYTLGDVGSWTDDGGDCGGVVDPPEPPTATAPPGLGDKTPPGLAGKTPRGWNKGKAPWKS